MTGFIMTAQLILGLSILVILHEFGHYLFAKIFKTRVEQFYLFFNPKISIIRAKKINGKWQVRFFSKNTPSKFRRKMDANGNTIKDEKGNDKFEPIPMEELKDNDWRKYPESTEWGLGWLPFGGYCSIAGMIDENKKANQLESEPQPWELRSKPAWQRLFVMIGGVVMNLVLGLALFVFVTYRYKQYLPNDQVLKNGIYVYDAGRQLGFETGDKILAVNGKKIIRFDDAIKTGVFFGSNIIIDRNGKQMNVVIPDTAYRMLKEDIFKPDYPVIVDSVLSNTPAQRAHICKKDKIVSLNEEPVKSFESFLKKMEQYTFQNCIIGVVREQDTLFLPTQFDSIPKIGIIVHNPYKKESYTFEQAVKYGISDAMDLLSANIKGFRNLIKGKEKATESLQGPIGIASLYGGVWDWAKFWFITAVISLILAFMNILPIPALDGGHLVFILIEMITRRKPSDKIIEYAQIAGMVILVMLMFFVIGNDIFKLFK